MRLVTTIMILLEFTACGKDQSSSDVLSSSSPNSYEIPITVESTPVPTVTEQVAVTKCKEIMECQNYCKLKFKYTNFEDCMNRNKPPMECTYPQGMRICRPMYDYPREMCAINNQLYCFDQAASVWGFYD